LAGYLAMIVLGLFLPVLGYLAIAVSSCRSLRFDGERRPRSCSEASWTWRPVPGQDALAPLFDRDGSKR
jgi:hypothetical protein